MQGSLTAHSISQFIRDPAKNTFIGCRNYGFEQIVGFAFSIYS